MLSSCFFANKRQCAKAQLNKPQRCARAYCVYFEMPKMHLGYVEQAATECGIPHMPIHSGAGHDAQFASYMLPTTMIFVQSKDGLSHCEPDDVMIASGAKCFADEKCDFLIAIGGGSPIDSMKAIAVNVSGKKSICDYYGEVIDIRLPPMIAIPTTAGTGSEATQFTVITDTKRKIKMLLKGAALVPDVAVVDGSFGISSPKTVTAFSAMVTVQRSIFPIQRLQRRPITPAAFKQQAAARQTQVTLRSKPPVIPPQP